MSSLVISCKPQLTQSYAQGNINRTFNLMFSMCKISYIVLYVLALPVIFEVNYILKLWLGTNLPTYTGIFVILVIGNAMFDVFSPPISFVVHATGKMAKYQFINGLFSISIIPISYMMLSLGANAETIFILGIVFTAIGVIISLVILRSIQPFSLYSFCNKVIKPLVIITLFSAIPPFIITHYMEEGFFRLLITTIVSIITIIVLTFSLGLNQSEKTLIYSIIKKITQK